MDCQTPLTFVVVFIQSLSASPTPSVSSPHASSRYPFKDGVARTPNLSPDDSLILKQLQNLQENVEHSAQKIISFTKPIISTSPSGTALRKLADSVVQAVDTKSVLFLNNVEDMRKTIWGRAGESQHRKLTFDPKRRLAELQKQQDELLMRGLHYVSLIEEQLVKMLENVEKTPTGTNSATRSTLNWQTQLRGKGDATLTNGQSRTFRNTQSQRIFA